MTWFVVYHGDLEGLVVVAEDSDPAECGGVGVVLRSARRTEWKRFSDAFGYGSQDAFRPGEREILTIDQLPDDLLAEWVKYNLSNQEGEAQ